MTALRWCNGCGTAHSGECRPKPIAWTGVEGLSAVDSLERRDVAAAEAMFGLSPRVRRAEAKARADAERERWLIEHPRPRYVYSPELGRLVLREGEG